jgi:hypothetical protein
VAAPVTAPTRPLSIRGNSGLLSLILLLLCAIAAAAAFTAYLLRAVEVAQPVAMPQPAPYRVWYRQGNAILAAGSDGQTHTVATLPVAQIGTVQTLSVAPDGRRMLLIADQAGAEHAWLLVSPSGTPQSLPAPGIGRDHRSWRYLAAAWTGSHSVDALLTALEPGGTRAQLARYTLADNPPVARVAWQPLQTGGAQVVSVSPTADQIALVGAQAGSGVFAPQVVVRLQHLQDARRTVALRYLGAQTPAAVLWSPDGGTVAISVPGQGLAIQKSSGRSVRQVADGALPAAFSDRGADLAYISGNANHWQIHVLNLHGEADHQFAAPGSVRPQWLRWTPDARALLCMANGTLWQIEPGAGTPTKLPGTLAGDPLAIVPAS